MPETHADDSFETLLRDSLAARPEPFTGTDFAARVLAEARAVAPPRTPAVWPVWVAVASVAAMVLLAAWRLAGTSAWQATEATVSQAATTNSVALLPIGGALFLSAVVWVIARSALSNGERFDVPGLG